jgi:hypothetical protein
MYEGQIENKSAPTGPSPAGALLFFKYSSRFMKKFRFEGEELRDLKP